jgi:hypothetical protein
VYENFVERKLKYKAVGSIKFYQCPSIRRRSFHINMIPLTFFVLRAYCYKMCKFKLFFKVNCTGNCYVSFVVKWNEHFTESAIFPLRQYCIYKVGNPLVESSGFYRCMKILLSENLSKRQSGALSFTNVRPSVQKMFVKDFTASTGQNEPLPCQTTHHAHQEFWHFTVPTFQH